MKDRKNADFIAQHRLTCVCMCVLFFVFVAFLILVMNIEIETMSKNGRKKKIMNQRFHPCISSIENNDG